MMSAALATRGHLKWKVFLNKGYDVLISVHDITKKNLSGNSNYIVVLVMWTKSSISMGEVIITSIL